MKKRHRYYRIFLSNYVDGNLQAHIDKTKRKKRNVKYYKALLFIICYNLSLLQYYIKGFRHNDLHLKNIFGEGKGVSHRTVRWGTPPPLHFRWFLVPTWAPKGTLKMTAKHI